MRFLMSAIAFFAITTAASAELSLLDEYRAIARKWAFQTGVTDRCYKEESKKALEQEAAAGAAAAHHGWWQRFTGARTREEADLLRDLQTAHGAGVMSEETCFMSLIVRDGSKDLLAAKRKLLELGEQR